MSIQVEGPTRKWKPVLYPYQGTNEPEWYAVAEWQPEVVLFFFLLWLCWKIPGRLVFTSLRHLLPKSNATVARLEWKRKTQPNRPTLFFFKHWFIEDHFRIPWCRTGTKEGNLSALLRVASQYLGTSYVTKRQMYAWCFPFFLLISLTPLLEGTVYLRIAFHKY